MPLAVPIHLQDDPTLCGAACVQMVARFLAPSKKLLSQPAVIATMAWGWGATPNQVRNALNKIRPKSVTPFKVYAMSSAAAAMAQVEAAILKGWPSVALTNGGYHWEVVTGFTDGGLGRIVHCRDPIPDRELVDTLTSAGTLPPHGDNDNCETLNVQTGGAPADEAQAWDTWLDVDYTKCTVAGTWKNKFVVVAPTLPPAPVWSPIVAAPRPAGPLLTPLRSGPVAWSALKASGLLTLPAWRRAMDAVSSGEGARAVSVARLDRATPYLLVDLTDGRGRGALVALDSTGRLLSARLNPAKLVEQIFADHGVGHQRLVWRPSEASFHSPFFPLSEMVVNGRTIYQRVFDRHLVPLRTPR